MNDINLSEGFQDLNAEEMESVEGGFIFTTLLGAKATFFRGMSETISDTLEVVAPVAYLLDRKTEAVFGTFNEVSGLFRRSNSRSS